MEGLDKSLPMAEGMIDAEQEGKVNLELPNRVCLNCNTPLQDKYCPHCGQRDIPRRQTAGELIVNFIGSFTSFESKFFRSLKFLLFRPGFLALEYTNGKRESYYHPARAYVFISFVFFLLFFSLPDTEDDPEENDSTSGLSYNDNGTNFKLDSAEYKTIKEYDSIQSTLSLEKRDGWIMRLVEHRVIELNQKYRNKGGEFSREFGEMFTANFPKVFFLLLPFFALLLKLLYIRRDFYYSEHLVFSIYYYNFFFLAGILVMLVDLVPWLEWASVIIQIWIFVYLLLAMKQMYKQKWLKTVAKYCIFFFMFSIVVGVGLLINLLATLMAI